MVDEARQEDDPKNLVWKVLGRDIEFEPLRALLRGFNSAARTTTMSGRVAIGFDTNAIFRVAGGSRGPDVVDFLAAKYNGPIILPGQVIQEVWNNQLSAISPLGKVLQQKFRELEEEAGKFDERFGELGNDVRGSIARLLEVHTKTFDTSTFEAFQGIIDALLLKADVPFVSRHAYHDLANMRRATKTPPGFKDSGFGDFFVWADYLLGVARARYDAQLDGAAFVTLDKKPDWSREGIPHPLLQAEAEAVANAPFELWGLNDLFTFVDAATRS